MQRTGWILGSVALLAGVLPLLEDSFTRAAHRLLARGAAPEAADLIAVFGGGGAGRILRGLELLTEGYAPRVLFLGTQPEMQCAHLVAKATRSFGRGRIAFGERAVGTTSASVDHLVEWVRKQGVARVMIVSDDWHLARISVFLSGHGPLGFEPVLVPTAQGTEKGLPVEDRPASGRMPETRIALATSQALDPGRVVLRELLALTWARVRTLLGA